MSQAESQEDEQIVVPVDKALYDYLLIGLFIIVWYRLAMDFPGSIAAIFVLTALVAFYFYRILRTGLRRDRLVAHIREYSDNPPLHILTGVSTRNTAQAFLPITEMVQTRGVFIKQKTTPRNRPVSVIGGTLLGISIHDNGFAVWRKGSDLPILQEPWSDNDSYGPCQTKLLGFAVNGFCIEIDQGYDDDDNPKDSSYIDVALPHEHE